MSYLNLLAITADSAIDTAAICCRKARRDCYRIHALLTHPRTVQAAKIAVWCLYLGAVIAFTLGQTARILVDTGAKAVQEWAEAEVQSCLVTEAAEEPATEADPFSPAENQHYPAMAATIATPAAVAVVKVEANAKQPTTAELRKRCIAHNQGLPKDDPRYIRNAARLTKAQALKALGMV